jgi:hypothetical protein
MNKTIITSTDQAIRILAQAITGNTFGVPKPKVPTPTTRRVAHIGVDGEAVVAIDVQRRIANALAGFDRKIEAAKRALQALCQKRIDREAELAGIKLPKGQKAFVEHDLPYSVGTRIEAANRKDWQQFAVRKDAMARTALGNA